MLLNPGQMLGPYEILAPLGAGGMGEVYRAKDARLGREVAVKILPAEFAQERDRLRRFEQEARAAAALNHPNILVLHDLGTHEGSPYIVTELLEGESLRQRLRGGALTPAKAVELAIQVAQGLAAAHEKGIVHRDLKPENLFVTKDGRIKILDFGLAKLVERDVPAEGGGSPESVTQDVSTETGRVMGTIGYMAPEQARGGPTDARSDVFSFGVVLYEMLSGKRPFERPSTADAFAALLKEDPPPLPLTSTSPLHKVVSRCLEKRPEDRYGSARDLLLALEAISAAEGVPGFSRRALPWLLRDRGAVTIAAGLLVFVAALLALDVGGLRTRLLGRKGASAPIRSLAVLPLANLSHDAEQDYFADGMTDELITNLAKIGALKVISRTSAMRYKGTQKPIKEIAHELGVDGIVEGSVLRSGDRVRITAQLIDASTDTHVWAESYERDLEDILQLQGEVAVTIAGAVRVALTPQERERLTAARRVNPEAYEDYLKGMYNWMKLTPQGIDASRGYLERALEKDPSYAPAYQGLAWYWLARQQMGMVAPSQARPQARAAAVKAIALDDGCAEAHEALAAVKWSEWDWAGSEREWRRTFELNPNLSNAHAYYAHFLAIVGRADVAVPHSRRAIELDPSNALFHGMFSVVLVYARRYDDALEEAKEALAIQPDLGVAKTSRQWVYVIKGMHHEQLADQRERIAKDPERVAAFEKGLAEGGYEGAQRAIADLLAARYEKAGGVPSAGPVRVYRPCGIAFRYLDAHDYDRALDWLEKAYDVRDPSLPYQIASPVYDPLRSHPRFRALTEKMGLPNRGAT